MNTRNKIINIQSIGNAKHGIVSIGDVIHIKRWYYGEDTLKFKNIFNCVMVDAKMRVDKITVDETTNKDTIWCGKFSTSIDDISNKGKVF